MKIERSFYQNNCNHFDKKQFVAPATEFAPIYSWTWNAEITKDGILQRLDDMQEMGIKAFYIIPMPAHFRPERIPTELAPEYLSDEFFALYAFAFDEAEKRGMYTWIYDEGGWPSGSACGKVLKENPHLAKRTLEMRKVLLAAGQAYALGENAMAAFIDRQRVQVGQVFDEDTEVTEYYSCIRFFQTPNQPDFPDLLLKESADKFIESTHEGYKKFARKHFGKTAKALFTDEPVGPGIVPAFVGIEEEFEKRYGYSIVPFFPVLKGAVQPTKADEQALVDFYDMCSALYCESFMLECKKWANENGLSFTGHVDKDDELLGSYRGGYNYNILRALRFLDIPGVDVIWRQIFQRETRYQTKHPFFPRLASSAAAQNGANKSMTESFAVYGPCVTYDEMRYVVGAQAIRGVNIFNPMLISYGQTGHFMAGELPNYSKSVFYYADLRHINEYMSRLSYITSLGVQKNAVALYMPTADYVVPTLKDAAAQSFNECGKALEGRGVAFDIFDNDVLENADESKLAQGKICVGLAEYTAIVMPACQIVPTQAQEKLATFEKGGGKVYSAKNIDSVAQDIPLKADGALLAKRVFANGELLLAFNKEQGQVCVEFEKTDKNAYFISITDGAIYPIENKKFAFVLQSGETGGVLLTDEKITAQATQATDKQIALQNFTLKKEKRFIIGDNELQMQAYDEQAQAVALGDWKGIVGEDFSGVCVYETTFTTPENVQNAVLDLGDVKHTAKVWLNGEQVGVKVMPPYRVALPIYALQKQNRLQIVVSNTPANEYVHTKSFEKMERYKLTVYFDKELEFCQDTMEQGSGLFGPVTISYK